MPPVLRMGSSSPYGGTVSLGPSRYRGLMAGSPSPSPVRRRKVSAEPAPEQSLFQQAQQPEQGNLTTSFTRAPRAEEAYGGAIKATSGADRMRSLLEGDLGRMNLEGPFASYYRQYLKGRKSVQPSGLIHDDVRAYLGPLAAKVS